MSDKTINKRANVIPKQNKNENLYKIIFVCIIICILKFHFEKSLILNICSSMQRIEEEN